ncbi:metal-dependent hydrolase [Halohasta salina]|uniref:metal-dependent hydrolase n=1 Tax=Halohasta salina TaxID=2961621 RepID=UPI0020A2C7B6|nr:metal-dependent hydrolase [Halohasta salina]
MWPLGHAAVAYLGYAGLRHARGTAAPEFGVVVALLVGSQLPDLVDKPLSWGLGVLPTGRSFAHSLVVLLPLVAAGVLLAVRWNRTEYGVAAGVGAVLHIFADSLPSLWTDEGVAFLLWPLLVVEPYESGPPTVGGLLVDSLGNPYLLVEFGLAALAVGVWRRDGYPGVAAVRHRLRALRRRLTATGQ